MRAGGGGGVSPTIPNHNAAPRHLRHDLYGVNDIVVAAGDRKLLRVLHHVVGQDGGVLLCGAAGGDAVGNPQDAAGHEEAASVRTGAWAKTERQCMRDVLAFSEGGIAWEGGHVSARHP